MMDVCCECGMVCIVMGVYCGWGLLCIVVGGSSYSFIEDFQLVGRERC